MNFEIPVSESVRLRAYTPSFVHLEKGLNEETRFTVFRVTDTSQIEVGGFVLAPFPGCCGIVISCFSSLKPDTQHSGLSNPFRELKEALAKELGYSLMVATTQMENIPAVGNFFKSKYKFVKTFINSRTDKLLGLGIKELK